MSSWLHFTTENLSQIIKYVPLQAVNLSTKQKFIVISVTASVAVVGMLARYLRRQKVTVDVRTTTRRPFIRRSCKQSGLRSPNGDAASYASSGRRSTALSNHTFLKQGSILASEKTSIASGSIISGSITLQEGNQPLTPQQLGVMGMEALETCISYWEDALSAYRSKDATGPLAVLNPDEANFCRELNQLLEAAIDLQSTSEMLFLDERSILFRAESTPVPGQDADISGGESFASAQDIVADLREFEDFSEFFPDVDNFPLYQQALKQLENSGIPCRILRTEIVKCGSDVEYLAKLHCLRLAFQHILRDQRNYIWFIDAGRQVLADLLLYADKDPKDFLIGYEEILKYIQDQRNWNEFEDELRSKGVKALTFYDVVMDYILMDAFEDLESPPSSVTAVVQNRWLSNGFKETALTTAVWSVLKAKRRMLKYPTGFMAHFYTLSEQLSPLLAWGFLGPDELLHDTCLFFKQQVMDFLADIFNFQKCKYMSVEDLADDVLQNIKVRVNNLCERLSVRM